MSNTLESWLTALPKSQSWMQMAFIIIYLDKLNFDLVRPGESVAGGKGSFYSDECHWKERSVIGDATLAAKLYAKPWGCISQRSSCIAAPLCIIVSQGMNVQHRIESQSNHRACFFRVVLMCPNRDCYINNPSAFRFGLFPLSCAHSVSSCCSHDGYSCRHSLTVQYATHTHVSLRQCYQKNLP